MVLQCYICLYKKNGLSTILNPKAAESTDFQRALLGPTLNELVKLSTSGINKKMMYLLKCVN